MISVTDPNIIYFGFQEYIIIDSCLIYDTIHHYSYWNVEIFFYRATYFKMNIDEV